MLFDSICLHRRLFNIHSAINSSLSLSVFPSDIAFYGFASFINVYWIRICDCCFQYDSRLNPLSCIGISPCYVELNFVLGFCELCSYLRIEFSLDLSVCCLNCLKEFYSLFLIRVLDFNENWILYLWQLVSNWFF